MLCYKLDMGTVIFPFHCLLLLLFCFLLIFVSLCFHPSLSLSLFLTIFPSFPTLPTFYFIPFVKVYNMPGTGLSNSKQLLFLITTTSIGNRYLLLIHFSSFFYWRKPSVWRERKPCNSTQTLRGGAANHTPVYSGSNYPRRNPNSHFLSLCLRQTWFTFLLLIHVSWFSISNFSPGWMSNIFLLRSLG